MPRGRGTLDATWAFAAELQVVGRTGMDSLKRVEILNADITTLAVDAIVNAANSALSGGGGVDGAIHDAAGPDLLVECRRLGPCPAGDARITKGYRLPANYVIHAVGPVWDGGTRGEEAVLASCYRAVIRIAVEHEVRTLAFPAISCGAYRFPVPRAADITLNTLAEELSLHPQIERVILALVDDGTERAFRRSLARILQRRAGRPT